MGKVLNIGLYVPVVFVGQVGCARGLPMVPWDQQIDVP